MSKSPRIQNMSWGRVTVEGNGSQQQYKDAKLWPGGSRGWDWNETGTSHVPGIQVADVKELVENGAQKVILSQGQNDRLQVKQETIDWLEEQDVEVEVMNSNDAVKQYNALSDQEAVGALIHSTC